jgi:hypothetical protein
MRPAKAWLQALPVAESLPPLLALLVAWWILLARPSVLLAASVTSIRATATDALLRSATRATPAATTPPSHLSAPAPETRQERQWRALAYQSLVVVLA